MTEKTDIIRKYLNAFEAKDINSLSNLLSSNVTLRDWELSAAGKAKVLSANQNIFDSCESIKISIVNLFANNHIALAEINITINSTDTIKVVDIYEFDSDNKICKIRAFKG